MITEANVFVVGHLTKDAYVKEDRNGRKVLIATIAVNNQKQRDEDGNEGEIISNFYQVSYHRQNLETILPLFKKGSPAIAIGELVAPTRKGPDGKEYTALYVNANKLISLAKKEPEE